MIVYAAEKLFYNSSTIWKVMDIKLVVLQVQSKQIPPPNCSFAGKPINHFIMQKTQNCISGFVTK